MDTAHRRYHLIKSSKINPRRQSEYASGGFGGWRIDLEHIRGMKLGAFANSYVSTNMYAIYGVLINKYAV